MKKLLLFLFILTLAAYWGYSRGGEYGRGHNPGASPSVEEKNSFPTADNLLDKITDLAGSFTARSADSSTKEKSDFIRESKEFLQSAKESFRQIFHFKEALESKIDRDNFVPAKEIPDLMKKAIVATEDRRFYDHGAVDLVGVARALVTNYIAGKTVEGGSTIAQQTVKNIFLSDERTLSRKIEELALAVQLEKYYSKDQILELYLNTIYFGHGAYGIKEACDTYFGKEAKDLDLSQCAMLAGLPQAPNAYDPLNHPEEGAQRMTVVLTLMAREGYITPEEAATAALDLWLK